MTLGSPGRILFLSSVMDRVTTSTLLSGNQALHLKDIVVEFGAVTPLRGGLDLGPDSPLDSFSKYTITS